MSEPNFHRSHEQHINISENLSKELTNSGVDLLKEIGNMDQKLLIKVINGTTNGIFGVIPDLQEIVIKSSTIEKENNTDLEDMIKKLCQDCNEMVQGYGSNFDIIKHKFIVFVLNVLTEADNLLKIIKKDDLHDFKHELVENLKEMMYTIQTSKLRIQIENYSLEELNALLDGVQKEYFEDIAILKNCSLKVLKTVVIHIKYNVKHVAQMAYHFNKVASNYHDVEIQKKILEAAKLLNASNTAVLLMSENIVDTKEAITELTKYVIDSWNAVRGLFEFVEIRLENKKHSENLKDIAMFLISYGIVINDNIGKSVKNDCLFA